MKKIALAVALVAMLAADASAVVRHRTVFVNRNFRNRNVVVVNNGFGVRNFGVFVAPTPVFLQPQFAQPFAVSPFGVQPYGFQTFGFQTFGGCH